MMQELHCIKCGKRLCDIEPDSTVEIMCRGCKTIIRYEKGKVTTK